MAETLNQAAGFEPRPFESQVLGNARWMIQLRWLAGLVIVAGTLLGFFIRLIPTNTVELLGIGVAVLAYNLVAFHVARRGDLTTVRRAQSFWMVQILADMIALTAIIYCCGGVESPVVIFYIIHMVCGAILLSPALSYLMATIVVALFGGVAALQASVPSLYHPLSLDVTGHYFDRWGAVGIELAAFTAAIYTSVYLTTTITRRLRESEKRVTRQRDVLNSIISSMSEAVTFLSPDGRLVLWNPAVERWFADRGADGTGLTGREDCLPGGFQEFVAAVRKASAPLPPQSFDMEVGADADSPARQYHANASGVFDRNGQHVGYVVVAEDRTEPLRFERNLRARNEKIMAMSEALRRSEKEAAQREKMVAIGTMVAGVAHEVGNPLACMSATVQLLKASRRDRDEEERGHIQNLQEQIQRIANIVRQLLEFARPAASERQLTDLDDLIEKTVRTVRYSSRARHARIECIREGEVPPVHIMPYQFQQVLVNVLLNALDAVRSPSGLGPGPNGGADAPVVRVTRKAEGGWVSVVVTDEGVGMTEEQVRHAFEPFYTTKAPGEGTGLGLAVSYRLVEQQGGRIHIDSLPREGTTVTMSFRESKAERLKTKV
jgi:signal transduction histidine kinase